MKQKRKLETPALSRGPWDLTMYRINPASSAGFRGVLYFDGKKKIENWVEIRNKKEEERKKDLSISYPASYVFPLTSARSGEAGNVFVLILLGIVLFVALSLSISRGMRSDTTSNLSKQEAALAASDILAYAQKVERAVNRLRRKGVSENDISFDQAFVAGYNHTPAVADTNKVFNADGGAISWKSPPEGSNDGSEWFFTGETCIADLGTGATGCDTDSIANEELIAVLPNVVDIVCEEINKRLNISAIPADTGGGASTTKYQGSFSDDTEIILAGGPFNAACFSDGANNHFYSILIAR
ncbi:MAG: hypothetical protein H6860_02470 [Rhodospirillales bacterium]|nr:hypothetical protein [Rhodospirillales bacterium]